MICETWRNYAGYLSAIIGILVGWSCQTSAAEEYLLRTQLSPGEIQQVKVKLEVGGELKVVNEMKVTPLKMSVVANFDYEEKILQGNPHQVGGLRTVRLYQKPDATIKIEKNQVLPVLRKDRRLIVMDSAHVENTKLYSPSGPLTREELDLLDVPGNSALVYTLLPAEKIKLNDTWKSDDKAWGALLGMDAVSTCDVESKLSKVQGDTLIIEAAGTIDAAVSGVATELAIKAKYYFNNKSQRITYFGIAVTEKRSVGHVSPGLDVVARVMLQFEPVQESKTLSEEALRDIPFDPNPAVLNVLHEKPGRYRFHHSRNWYVVDEDSHRVSLRLVESGELLAQCNLSTPEDKEPPKATMSKFQQQIQQVLDKSFKQFDDAATVPSDAGHTIFRVAASGIASELPITWIYYMVESKEGQQVIVSFTMETPLLEGFKQLDYEMVSSIEFLKLDESKQPTPVEAAAQKDDTETKTK